MCALLWGFHQPLICTWPTSHLWGLLPLKFLLGLLSLSYNHPCQSIQLLSQVCCLLLCPSEIAYPPKRIFLRRLRISQSEWNLKYQVEDNGPFPPSLRPQWEFLLGLGAVVLSGPSPVPFTALLILLRIKLCFHMSRPCNTAYSGSPLSAYHARYLLAVSQGFNPHCDLGNHPTPLNYHCLIGRTPVRDQSPLYLSRPYLPPWLCSRCALPYPFLRVESKSCLLLQEAPQDFSSPQ